MAESIAVPQVLVTGASGFIATHIIQQLLRAGQTKVRGTVRSLSNEAKVKPLQELLPNATYPLELVEADLLNEISWREAVRDCTYVYHVASPLPIIPPSDENKLIKPAVDGTLNVLNACAESGTVKRVVITGAGLSVSNGFAGRENGHVFTESDWSDEATLEGYAKSKLLAERAAWDFIDKIEDGKKFELVVAIPVAVMGPLLTDTVSSSLAFLESFLTKKVPMLANIGVPIIDVRDVAAAHIAAMEIPEAAGKRYILYGKSLWMREMADIIRREFEPQGYSIPTAVAPKPLLWILKFFSSSVRQFYPGVNSMIIYSNERMRNELFIPPGDVRQAIIDGCYSLIEKGIVEKKPGYTGPRTSN